MVGKFFCDMFLGIMPAILPEVREQFALSLTRGVNILFALHLSANMVQLLISHLRSDKRKPLLLYIALVLAGTLCFLGAVPKSPGSFGLLIILVIITACGNGMYNPEGLRAIHKLRHIPASISSCFFMSGGFAGYAIGGLVSTALVSGLGLRGLYFLFLCPAVAIFVIVSLRVRLFVERERSSLNTVVIDKRRLPFWPIVFMAILAAVSSNIIGWLLPTRLNELGFELTFGGFSVMMFCLGAAVGSFFWAWIAHKKGELPCSIIALFLGIPFVLAYLLKIDNRTFVWVLFGAGFCSLAAYPMMITMARYAVGPNLGRRMGFIVGGVWGVACVVLMILGPAAERFGVHAVLRFAPVGYLLSGIVGLLIMFKIRRLKRENRLE